MAGDSGAGKSALIAHRRKPMIRIKFEAWGYQVKQNQDSAEAHWFKAIKLIYWQHLEVTRHSLFSFLRSRGKRETHSRSSWIKKALSPGLVNLMLGVKIWAISVLQTSKITPKPSSCRSDEQCSHCRNHDLLQGGLGYHRFPKGWARMVHHFHAES